MKQLIIITLVFLSIAATSCTKHGSGTGYAATGVITGQDLTMCACCGGYILKINGSSTGYRFWYFPAGSTIDSTHFPINVALNYTYVSTLCTGNHLVSIQSMKKID